MQSWLKLDELVSRGSSTKKAGSLGALHTTRKITLSQFFTPEWLVKFIWLTVSSSFKGGAKYSLFDNSLGAGSMFRYADPDTHTINGFDIDSQLMEKVTDILDESGFEIDICTAAMESVVLGKYSVGLINPPFSIPLSSRDLVPYSGVTHYGVLGPDTSAISHEYALMQALDHCDIVAAVVPHSTTIKLSEFGSSTKRLVACFNLPSNTFRSENVEYVNTDLLIFTAEGQTTNNLVSKAINIDSPYIPLHLKCRSIKSLVTNSICRIGEDEFKPVILIPASDDKRVVMSRSGRNIKLRFFDGATEGRVMNSILGKRIFTTHVHKYSRNTKYSGQYKLSLDVLVLQDDPMKALNDLAESIKSVGGVPVVSNQLVVGLKSLVKTHEKMSVPFGRTVYRLGTPVMKATALKMGILNRNQVGAVVALNESVTALRVEGGFKVTTSRGVFDCPHDRFFATFRLDNEAANESYWEEVFPPIEKSFPDDIALLCKRAKALGLDNWLTWDFQFEDLLELAFRPEGAICGWQMALGKSRLALSLATLLEGTSLIVVKSRLVDEMVGQMHALGLGARDFKLIRTISDTDDLAKINLISYETLRQPLDARCPKYSFAKLLKGKITNILADEGGLLANEHSQQTTAVWTINAKRRYIFDGTPCPNYPREMLPLASWVFGQAKSYQPYSSSKGFIEPRLVNSAEFQPTGRDAFLNDYVCFEWATNEFLDNGTGAKREVPKIKSHNLVRYRNWISPMIKRRVQQEPAVSKHVKFPIPKLNLPVKISWDLEHLLVYISAVEDFANWYSNYVATSKENRKSLSLVLILARLEACFKAANAPDTVSGFSKPYLDMTSKQRAAIQWIKNQVRSGRRPIVFARNPKVLKKLGAELDAAGISNLVFTGNETIKNRIKKLNSDIRNGDAQVMLASLGVTQDGLNLPQLNCFLFYNRSWKSREEFQGIYRLIRPQQTSDVFGDFLHLEGSIDEYMGQLIEWKALASEAGLDFGEQPDEKEFVHFDAFINKFLETLPTLRNEVQRLRHTRKVA